MKKQKKVRKTARLIDNILEVPKEISTGLPKITILGFNELLIENYKGILEYEEFFIRVNTHIGIININGLNFNLKQMTDEELLISGKIENIELEEE